uniref:Uncharacterized protein n=1 Tax=Arundo donax TaxID=35708 RepID=A0A0A8YLV0_ARUDO
MKWLMLSHVTYKSTQQTRIGQIEYPDKWVYPIKSVSCDRSGVL